MQSSTTWIFCANTNFWNDKNRVHKCASMETPQKINFSENNLKFWVIKSKIWDNNPKVWLMNDMGKKINGGQKLPFYLFLQTLKSIIVVWIPK